jgi:hypothetical protein
VSDLAALATESFAVDVAAVEATVSDRLLRTLARSSGSPSADLGPERGYSRARACGSVSDEDERLH